MEMDRFLEKAMSEGSLDSSGRFTVDLERALRQLQRFQLADPHAYVQTIVATAVLGGASFLEITTSQGSCAFRFDGRTLEAGQLNALVGLQGDLFEREFSLVLLHCLGMEPSWLRVQSSGGCLRMAEGALVVDDDSGCEGNLVIIGPAGGMRRRLNRLVALPELRLLKDTCRLAALRVMVNGKQADGVLNFGRCLAARPVGANRTLKARAQPQIEPIPLPVSTDWSGLLVIGSEKRPASQVLVNGVAYPLPFALPYPRAGALISADLPLDLSRAKLAEGVALDTLRLEVEAEFDQLALEIAMAGSESEVLAHLWQRHVPRLRAGDTYPFARKLRETPLYLMADGSHQDLGFLVDQNLRDGYLGVSSRLWPRLQGIKRVWEPGRLLLRTSYNQRALDCLNWISLDHLVDAKKLSVLPSTDYLVRVPLPLCPGEVGLYADTPIDRFAFDLAERPANALPLGVHIAPKQAPVAEVLQALEPLYRGLLWRKSGIDPDLITDHLLVYLSKIVEEQPGVKLAQLLQAHGGALREFASVCNFSTIGGKQMSLLDLSQRPLWTYREKPGGPPAALHIDHLRRTRLLALLGPGSLQGHGLNHFSRAVSIFQASIESLDKNRTAPITTRDWLRVLLQQTDSAAYNVLRELGVAEKDLKNAEEILRLSPAAPREAGSGRNSDLVNQAARFATDHFEELMAAQVSTDHLLLGLLQVGDCDAGRCLKSWGLDYARVRSHVENNRHREAIADLTRGLVTDPNPLDFFYRADLRTHRNELELAKADALQALKLESDFPPARKLLAQLAKSMPGRLAKGT